VDEADGDSIEVAEVVGEGIAVATVEVTEADAAAGGVAVIIPTTKSCSMQNSKIQKVRCSSLLFHI